VGTVGIAVPLALARLGHIATIRGGVMQFELSHDKRNISDSDLLSDICRVATEEPEKQLKQRTYNEFGRYGVTTIIRRFGSWNAAIKAAGLATTVERNISDNELFSALYELWVALGRQPSYSEIKKPSCQFHVSTYERRFGSWRHALEAFVSYANSEDLTAPSFPAGIASSWPSSRSPDLRLRFKVLRRDHFRCCVCGASPSVTHGVLLQVDHIQPWSKGGQTTIENLQTLCSACNQGKTNEYDG
jgi:5-methylcytosine-specific restriction endonuclease McrA